TQFLHGLTQALTPELGVAAPKAALAQVALLVQREALTLTYNDVLMLMAGVFFLAVPLVLLLAKPKAAVTGAH
ncbi:MAG TPA: hypothetical protein VL154_12420, partial [Acetobacteraceae bacterium]|nr:hypothetical protein [Acetobacteraceae bacterium]